MARYKVSLEFNHVELLDGQFIFKAEVVTQGEENAIATAVQIASRALDPKWSIVDAQIEIVR